MKKFVKQARLPRGAYVKTLGEVIEPYARRALKEGNYRVKRLVEVFPSTVYQYEMPEQVFNLLTGAYEQAQGIQSNTTYHYMVRHLPDELKHKIKILTINHVKGENKERFETGADLVQYYYNDDYEL